MKIICKKFLSEEIFVKVFKNSLQFYFCPFKALTVVSLYYPKIAVFLWDLSIYLWDLSIYLSLGNLQLKNLPNKVVSSVSHRFLHFIDIEDLNSLKENYKAPDFKVFWVPPSTSFSPNNFFYLFTYLYIYFIPSILSIYLSHLSSSSGYIEYIFQSIVSEDDG